MKVLQNKMQENQFKYVNGKAMKSFFISVDHQPNKFSYLKCNVTKYLSRMGKKSLKFNHIFAVQKKKKNKRSQVPLNDTRFPSSFVCRHQNSIVGLSTFISIPCSIDFSEN